MPVTGFEIVGTVDGGPTAVPFDDTLNLLDAREVLVGGPRADRRPIWPRRLRAECAQAGLRWRGAFALGRYRRELWLAWLERVD